MLRDMELCYKRLFLRFFPPGYRSGTMQIRTNATAVLQKIVKIGNAVPMQDSRNNRKTEHKKRADYRIFAGNNGITYHLQ